MSSHYVRRAAELEARVKKLEGHLDWIGWDSEGIEKAHHHITELKTKVTEIQLGGIDLLTDRDRLEAENERLTAELDRLRDIIDDEKPFAGSGGE